MSQFRSGYITVVGVPNAGKSSLVNALVREAVSIVTAKPQTTRKRTVGILTVPDDYQMIFVDTPGVVESDAGLNKFLKHELHEALRDVDVVVAAIAPWEFETDELPWALKMKPQLGAKPIFIATQIDKKNEDPMLPVHRFERWKKWTEDSLDTPLLLTSSRKGDGLDELKNEILARLPEGPQYFDTDIFTPQTMREITTEAIRKQCFELLHQELPYGLAVMVQKFEEGPILKVEADVLLTKESHKGMVIGQGGKTLKEIGSRARVELERVFGKKMYIKLHVVVKPHWIKDRQYLEELGYGGS